MFYARAGLYKVPRRAQSFDCAIEKSSGVENVRKGADGSLWFLASLKENKILCEILLCDDGKGGCYFFSSKRLLIYYRYYGKIVF